MLIRSGDIFKGYTKIDSRVITDMEISDGAYRLYSYLCNLRSGINFVDTYIMKALKISQQTLTKRKRELKDAELILVDQIAPRLYVLYVGNTFMNVYKTKQKWLEMEKQNMRVESKK